MAIKDDVEHNIWWQMKGGNSSYWYDKWTGQGALYYVEHERAEEEELEVMEFVENGEWSRDKLASKLSQEMVEFIVDNIKVPNMSYGNDIPWWTGNSQGSFSAKSAWENN